MGGGGENLKKNEKNLKKICIVQKKVLTLQILIMPWYTLCFFRARICEENRDFEIITS